MKAKFVNEALNEKLYSMGSLYHIEKWIKEMWEKMEAKFSTDEELGEFFEKAEGVIGEDACQFIDQQASADFLHYHQNGPHGGPDTSDFIDNFDEIQRKFESLLNSRGGGRGPRMRAGRAFNESTNEAEEPVRFTGNAWGSVERSRGQGWPGMGGWGDPLQTAVLHGERGRQERAAELKKQQRVTTPEQQARIDARYRKKLEAIDKIERELENLEYELEDLQDKIKEGSAWEIEEFFGEIGSQAADVVNSGIPYKEKLQRLEELGVKNPKSVMQEYDSYYPASNLSVPELEKIDNAIEKIQKKIKTLKERERKLNNNLYENINEEEEYGDFDYDTRDSEVGGTISTPEDFQSFIEYFEDEIDGTCQVIGAQCANDKMKVVNDILSREGMTVDTEGWEDLYDEIVFGTWDGEWEEPVRGYANKANAQLRKHQPKNF